jgi:hypothetical protein
MTTEVEQKLLRALIRRHGAKKVYDALSAASREM